MFWATVLAAFFGRPYSRCDGPSGQPLSRNVRAEETIEDTKHWPGFVFLVIFYFGPY